MALRGLGWGILVGGLTGFCLGLPFFVIGGLVGIIWGGGIGARVGLAASLIIAFVTYQFFYPLKVEHRQAYKQMCLIICPLVAAAGTMIGLPGSPSVYFSLLPAIITGICALALGHYLAEWYLARSIKNG